LAPDDHWPGGIEEATRAAIIPRPMRRQSSGVLDVLERKGVEFVEGGVRKIPKAERR
jgi:hypothetical protein